jgi:ribosome-binding protein aMBF1 (putative translation factor)
MIGKEGRFDTICGFTHNWLGGKMAKTSYEQYAEKRSKKLSAAGKAAQEVFGEAYEISAMLLELRRIKKLTQIQLAKRSGIQQADISRMENGNHIPNTSTLLKLMKALDVTIELNVHPKRSKVQTKTFKIKQLAS